MTEKNEDISLPNANIMRILKEAIPDGINVSKDARLAFAKASAIFVMFLTSYANSFAMKAKRKTLLPSDVFESLPDIELEHFAEPLQKALEAYQLEKGKKDNSAGKGKRKKIESPPKSKHDSVGEAVEQNYCLPSTSGINTFNE